MKAPLVLTQQLRGLENLAPKEWERKENNSGSAAVTTVGSHLRESAIGGICVSFESILSREFFCSRYFPRWAGKRKKKKGASGCSVASQSVLFLGDARVSSRDADDCIGAYRCSCPTDHETVKGDGKALCATRDLVKCTG